MTVKERAAQFARETREYFVGLREVFTPSYFTYLTIVYCCVKGFVYIALSAVMLPFYKNVIGVTGSEYQKFSNVAVMAYAMKPVMAIVSDKLPILGYNKRYYVAVYSLLGSVPLIFANLAPGEPSSAVFVTCMFFLNSFGIAGIDILCEGKYSELMAADPSKRGAGIVSWIWGVYMAGGVVASAVEGPIADDFGARVVIWIIMPICACLLVPTLLGWIPELKVTKKHDDYEPVDGAQPAAGPVVASAAKQRPIIALGLATSAAAIGGAVVTLLLDNMYILIYYGVVVVVLFTASFMVLPRATAKANLFMFLNQLLYIQIQGAMDFFFTAAPDCLPDGPNFSFTYYQTFGGIAANIAGILGSIMFQKVFMKKSFRVAIWITLALRAAASVIDIAIVERWNIAAGIPDKVAYVGGDGVVFPLVTMLLWLPSSILISRMCPDGMEATVFALLAGFSNFGQTVSRTIGYVLIDAFGIKTVVPCDFSNLTLLIVVCHMLVPLLVVPFTLLLPNLKIDDTDGAIMLLDEDPAERHATSVVTRLSVAARDDEATRLFRGSTNERTAACDTDK
jgi:folate/biopterin transporter